MKYRPRSPMNADKKNERVARIAPRPHLRGADVPGAPALDYKDLDLLRKFVTSSSKLMSRKRTGMTAQEQSDLKIAVKRARFMALIPYTGF